MKKLEWITWKTEESELINPEELVGKLKERFANLFNISTLNTCFPVSIRFIVDGDTPTKFANCF